MNIGEIRQQYPMYSDISDDELASKFHTKFYSDIPKEDFYIKLGIKPKEVSTLAQQSSEEIAKSYTDDTFLGKVGTIAAAPIGVAESVLPIVSGGPAFIAGTLGKLGSLAQGKTSDEELQTAAEAATPQLLKDITYEPRTKVGQLFSRGLSEGFTQAGRGLAATGAGLRGGVEAALEGTGQTGAQTKFEDYYKQTAPVTQALFEAGMVGKSAMDTATLVRDIRMNSKLNKAKAEYESTKQNLNEGFEWNPTNSRLEKQGLHVDPQTGQIVNSTTGATYGWYDKAQNKPEAPVEAQKALPLYAGEPLVTFPDGTTMTRAEFEQQRRLTQDREGTTTGITPRTPVMSPKDIAMQDTFGDMAAKADEISTLPKPQVPVEIPKSEVVSQEPLGAAVDTSQVRNPFFTKGVDPSKINTEVDSITGVSKFGEEVVTDKLRDRLLGQMTPERTVVDSQRISEAWFRGILTKFPEKVQEHIKSAQDLETFIKIHEVLHNKLGMDEATVNRASFETLKAYKEDPVGTTVELKKILDTRSIPKEDLQTNQISPQERLPDEALASMYASETSRKGLGEEQAYYPTQDIPSMSPAQLRADMEQNVRKLETINTKLTAAETSPSGSVDLASLEASRRYLERKIDNQQTAISKGRKAGISFQSKGSTSKKQGGSVDFGFSEFVVDQTKKLLEKTPTYEQFVKSIGAMKDDPSAKLLYDKYYGKEITVKPTAQQQAISRIPGMKDIISPELIPLDHMMERWKTETDLGSGPIEKALRENLSSGGRMTAMRTGNTFIDWNVENILTTTRKAQVDIKRINNDIKAEVNQLTKGLLSRFKDKGAGEKVFVETMTQMLKAKGQDVTPNIPKEGRAIYEKVNKALADLGIKLQEELKSQGVDNFVLRPNYLAGTFFGPYRSIVKDATGKTIGVVAGRTKNEASHAIDYIKEQMPDVSFDLVEYNPKFDSTATTLSARYGKASEVLDLLKNQNESSAKLQDTLSDYYAKVQENYMGYKHHFKKSGDVFGSEGSRSWVNAKDNAYDLLEAQLGVIDHGYHWLAEQKLMKDMDTVLKNPEIGLPESKAYVNAYLDHAFGRTKDYMAFTNSAIDFTSQVLGISPSSFKEMSAILRNVALTNTLGLSGGFILTQGVQIPTALIIAYSRAKDLGISGNKSGSSMLGSMDMVHGIAKKYENMSEEGKYFFNYFKDNGVMDPHLVEQTIHRKLVTTTGMSPIKKAIWETVNAGFKLGELESGLIGKVSIEAPEAFTRGTFAMSMAHFYKSAGYSLKEAAVQADKDTSTLFVDYSAQERAMMFQRMGELGKLASTVSTFKLNNLNQWVTFKNAKMYGALSALALTTWFTTGMYGMPGGDEAEFLATWAKSKGMDLPTPREYMLKSVPDVVAFGPLSSALKPFGGPGVAIHRKFAQDNIIPDDLVSFLYPLLSFYTNKVSKTQDWIKSDFGKQHGAVLAREIVPGNLKYLVDYVGLTNEKGLTIDPNQIGDKYPAHYDRSKADWKVGAYFGVPSQNEFKVKQIKQLSKVSEQARKTATASKVKATVSAFNSGNKAKFDQLAQDALQYSPEASEEINSYLQSQAIARSIPIDKLLEYQFAQKATTAHGINRFQQFKQMQENR